MTKLLDGPAAGEMLMLRRAPLYLRVVRNRLNSKVDALDQLTDMPSADEDCFVYVRVAGPWRIHINARGRCLWYSGGEYRFVTPQPTDEEIRTTAAWRAWASAKIVTDVEGPEAES